MANTQQVENGVRKLVSGFYTQVLDSSKAIGSGATAEHVRNARGLLGTVAKSTKTVEQGGTAGNVKEALKQSFSTAEGNVDWGTVAGSYLGVTAGARVLSGGGVYKDSNGNTNLISVPFV